MCFNDLSLKKPIQLKTTVLKSKIRGDPCYCGFTIELQHRMGIMEDLIWTSNAPPPPAPFPTPKQCSTVKRSNNGHNYGIKGAK